MASKTEFRDPVFVRNDDTTEISASVVVWGGRLDGVSVLLKNGNGESILINEGDWPALVSCVNRELERVS